MNIGIVGAGAIALASAAWLDARGHAPMLWAPRASGPDTDRSLALASAGLLDARIVVPWAGSVGELAVTNEFILIAIPVNGHQAVMDALAPHLHAGQTVLVSSMASLSSLYLHEQLHRLGIAGVTVASLGSTVLTARREAPDRVRILTRRKSLAVSALPVSRRDAALELCTTLFGEGFTPEVNALASALSNTNPVAHAPLALFNWTRIERAEHWPQYHYMTPRVAAVIERLDAERLALAAAFGLSVRSIEQHFVQSFGVKPGRLAGIAEELHASRGGPPGPINPATRYLAEDVPFGLAFAAALGRLAQVPTPATDAIVATAGLLTGHDCAAGNTLIDALGLAGETAQGLLARVNA